MKETQSSFTDELFAFIPEDLLKINSPWVAESEATEHETRCCTQLEAVTDDEMTMRYTEN